MVDGRSCPSRVCEGTWHVSCCPVRLPSLGAVNQLLTPIWGSWPRSPAHPVVPHECLFCTEMPAFIFQLTGPISGVRRPSCL